MGTTSEHDRMLEAPDHLGTDTRGAFGEAADELLEAMPKGEGSLVIDLGATQYVDTAGLGTLAHVHHCAAESGHVVRLNNVNEEIRFSLVLARLEGLFEVEPSHGG